MIDDFGLFWNAYPRKTSVVSARQAWAIAITKADPKVIIEAADRLAKDPNREPTFTPSPANWLAQERWMDDPMPPRKISPVESREAELDRAKQRDTKEREKALEAIREAEEARARAVPLPPEIKKRLLDTWAQRAYPEP
jgi:hypothetical protein